MARETKAERLAREQAEREAYQAMLVESYQDRLMTVLEKATTENFELEVCNRLFALVDRDDRSEQFELTLNYTDESEHTLNELTWRLEYKEQQRLASDARFRERQAAIAKLTVKERELLGLE